MFNSIEYDPAKPSDATNAATLKGPQVRRPLADLPLSSYLELFELDLSKLDHDQLLALVAARNAPRLLTEITIPSGSNSDDLRAQKYGLKSDRPVNKPNEPKVEPTSIPSDSISLSFAQGAEDLEFVLAEELLFEELDPAGFARRLDDGDVMIEIFSESSPQPSENTEPRLEAVMPERLNQHAYGLLDASQTMGFRDRRGAASKGLMIRFLMMGEEQDAVLALRSFRSAPGELMQGRGAKSLQQIVRATLNLTYEGNTSISKPILKAAEDIRAGGDFAGASILLITDGIAPISETSPLRSEALYTILIGDPPAYKTKHEHEEGKRNLKNLRMWCDEGNFITLERAQIDQLLLPSASDIESFHELVSLMSDRLRDAIEVEQVHTIDTEIDNFLFLIGEFDKGGSARTPGIEALIEQVSQLRKDLGLANADEIVQQNRERIGTIEVARRQKLSELAKERIELESKAKHDFQASKATGEGKFKLKGQLFGDRSGSVTELFKELWYRVRSFVSKFCARIVARMKFPKDTD